MKVKRFEDISIDQLLAKGVEGILLDADGTLDDNEVLSKVEALKSGAALTVNRSGSAVSTFSFDANGFLVGTLPVSISYRTSPEYCARDRDVQISASGQVRIAERDCS